MNSRKLKITGAFTSLIVILFAYQHCGKIIEKQIDAKVSELQGAPITVAVDASEINNCPDGGLNFKTFADANLNGMYDVGEVITSTQDVCNGADGANGENGNGAGISVTAASVGSCSAGGITVKTFIDNNNNAVLDSGELMTSVSSICNGVAGTNGKSSELTATAASPAQCLNGGVVYTSTVTGLSPQSNVICNGVNGTSATVSQKVASEKQCPTGGTVVEVKNQGSDPVYSVICNGATGKSAYITTSVASPYQCSSGGIIVSTWVDAVNPKVDIVCNGLQGTTGSSPTIYTSNADSKQCSAGGIVITTTSQDSKTPTEKIICNGAQGAAGENSAGGYIAGIVGPMIEKKNLSACHHDFLYFPATGEMATGWLTFRHQRNGSEDQGIGTTGFNVWNVDIANFSLVSEVGNVTYCNLTYDPKEMTLKYTVVDKTDGLAGKSGTIKLSK